MTNKKIAFFGTPAFTTDFLDTLAAAGYTPSLVITNPDAPRGRGMVLTPPEPKVWATRHTISVLQPEKLDDAFFGELQKESWDLFVVIAYGKIIPEKIITLPTYGTINVHYSLLPKYRGATPVESAILNGDTETGVSIQAMRFKLDAGPIIAEKRIPIAPDDTTPTLRDKLNTVALEMLPQTITTILDGSVQTTEQDESLASHCGKIQKEAGRLNLADDGITNYRKYRAYYGGVGTYFFKDGRRIKITNAHQDGETFVVDEVIPENGKRIPYSNL